MPRSKKRRSKRNTQVQRTQAAQQESVRRKTITPAQYMRRRIFGWSLCSLAVLVGASHWLAHIGLLYDDSGWLDLALGYPMAGLIAVSSAIVLSR